MGMVFQSYAIWPHMTVVENVAYPLKLRRVRGREIRERVRARAGAGRAGRAWRSGRRRCSAAASSSAWRSPARSSTSPTCCCSTSRSATSTPSCASRCAIEVKLLQKRLGITVLLVTHDQIEALSLSNRIA